MAIAPEPSILNTVKLNLGIEPSDTDFDDQLISAINSAFATCYQIGIGEDNGFHIETSSETWDDYMEPSFTRNMAIDLISKLVKKNFDPPTSSVLMQAVNEEIAELEYRIIIQLEANPHEE